VCCIEQILVVLFLTTTSPLWVILMVVVVVVVVVLIGVHFVPSQILEEGLFFRLVGSVRDCVCFRSEVLFQSVTTTYAVFINKKMLISRFRALVVSCPRISALTVYLLLLRTPQGLFQHQRNRRSCYCVVGGSQYINL
jgi:hypothetical protein